MLLAQVALCAGVVAATLLQFIGALQVREYGRRLAALESRESGLVEIEDGDIVEKEDSYDGISYDR